MKFLAPGLVGCALFAALSGVSSAAVIGFWDFNDHPDLTAPTVQIIHNATTGSGIIYEQKAEMDLNGKAGTAYVNAADGLNSVAGKGMGWNDFAKNGSADDGEFFIVFSTLNFTNIVLSFDVAGNTGEGVTTFDLKYSLNTLADNPAFTGSGGSGTIKLFDTTKTPANVDIPDYNNRPFSSATLATTDYIRVSFDLSTVSGLNNQGYVALRFDDLKANNDLSIDNFLITGTAVPEPSVALLGGIGVLGLLRRRR